jgi:chemotaxis-related protein WspD
MSQDRLLDRPSPDDYIEEWTTRIAMPKARQQAATDSIFIVRIAAEWFGLASRFVDELGGIGRIHRIPHRRSGTLLGVVNVRGQLVVCVSLLEALHLAHDSSSYKNLVVLKDGQLRLGIAVHEVFGIHRYPSGDIQRIASTQSERRYTSGIVVANNTQVACLDTPSLLAALRKSLS